MFKEKERDCVDVHKVKFVKWQEMKYKQERRKPSPPGAVKFVTTSNEFNYELILLVFFVVVDL